MNKVQSSSAVKVGQVRSELHIEKEQQNDERRSHKREFDELNPLCLFYVIERGTPEPKHKSKTQ